MDNQFAPSSFMSFQTQPTHSTYGSQSQPAQQGAQQHDPNHVALPPLQSQPGFAQFSNLTYGHPNSASQPGTAPATPVTQSTNGYPHLSPANGTHNGFASAYPLTTQSMGFPSSVAPSMAATQTSGLPTIRPMPPATVPASLSALPSLATSHLNQQSPFLGNEEAPTHVVGSQGRRGILPSEPGRPAPAAGAAGANTKAVALQKDANGKFPCPHCNKTYLHAKHLKRHMLRHTGDRPYSCHLCKDTFSRSDILKRHFQKCSIRRGNPTGLSHLAHQRRGNNSNRLSISQQDGPIGLASLSEVSGNNPYSAGGLIEQGTPVNGGLSTRSSRANSTITPATMSHRNSVSGLGIVSPNGHGPDLHAQPQFGAPNMHGYGLSSGGPMASAYAFSQPPINPQFYQPLQAQHPLPYLNHAGARYDHSHNNSPHNQSPTVGDTHHQFDNVRLLAQDGQDNFMNGSASLGAEDSKADHDKHFGNDLNDSAAAPMASAWS